MKTINGMPAEDARKLDALALSACAKVEAVAGPQAYEALTKLEVGVGTKWSRTGTTSEYDVPRTLFPTQEAWAAALVGRTREAKTTAAALIAALDPPAAAALFREVAWLSTESSHQISYEAGLVRAFWARWEVLTQHLPPTFAAELFLAGKLRFDALTDAHVAAIPLSALAESADRAELDNQETSRLLECHPELRSVAQRLAFAEAVIGPSWERRQIALTVVEGLIMDAAEEAQRWALRLFEMDDREDPHLVSLAIATNCLPVLERLWADIEQRRARAKLRWDPHHADPIVGPSIRAGFALDPAHSARRFAPFFTRKSVASEGGAKLANDVWMLGTGESVRHGATHFTNPEGDLLSLDAEWFPLVARHVHHPRLGRHAMSLLKRLTARERKALIEEHGGEPPPQQPAKPNQAASTKRGSKKA